MTEEKIQNFKVRMRELLERRNVDIAATSEIENLMETYL